jgi:transcriptional regulator NrdR family protein
MKPDRREKVSPTLLFESISKLRQKRSINAPEDLCRVPRAGLRQLGNRTNMAVHDVSIDKHVVRVDEVFDHLAYYRFANIPN